LIFIVTNIISVGRQRPDPLAIIDSATHLTESTRAKYRRVLSAFLDEGGDLADPQGLAAFADSLSQSRQAQLRAAVSLWVESVTLFIQGQATPDNLNEVEASIHRLTALKAAVRPRPQKGSKLHTWLSPSQVRELLAFDCNYLIDWRDKVALSLMVGAGLRREEAAQLRIDQVQMVPGRHVLQIMGKGKKQRVVPISLRMSQLFAGWQREAAIYDGFLLRSVDRNGRIGASLSSVSLFKIVRAHGKRLGLVLAPHDLRRTYAQIGYENGTDIGEISRLLGHSSIKTTQRYLNLDTNFQKTISDHVPL
jgi:integrase